MTVVPPGPLDQDSPLGTTPGTTPGSTPGPASPSGLCGLRILLVDDSPDVLTSLGLLLELHGAHVTTASGGCEALAKLEGAPADVIVSDLSMPDMTGLELMRQIRSRPLQPRPLAVACSGFGRPQDRQAALDSGFDDALGKPFAVADLERMIISLRSSTDAR